MFCCWARKSCSGSSAIPPTEHPDIDGSSVDNGALEGARFTNLPPELMFKIFDYLHEDDLAQCALVSRKFRTIVDHQISWKLLYQEVFEYSLPLLHVGHGRFEFRELHDWPQPRSDKSIVVNPWKESFMQLRNVQALQKHGIHVRPGYASLYSRFSAGGRRLTQCDRLDQALLLVEARGKNAEKLIFLHTGLYILEATVRISSDIQIIGASAGPDIASRVIIEGRLDTTVVLEEGSQGAYLGWMTVRFAPDSEAVAAGNPPMHTHPYALRICDNSTALVEHCVIHSSATFWAAVYVKGSAANPKMRHCVVCDCESAGIYVTDAAQGQFEDCEIARNDGPGVCVNNRANPFFQRCHIHDGRYVGVRISDKGRGVLEDNDIYRNAQAGVAILFESNPTLRRNRVYEGCAAGVEIRRDTMATLESNAIFHNRFEGLCLETGAKPTLRDNKIYDNDSALH